MAAMEGRFRPASNQGVGNLDGTSVASFYAALVGLSKKADELQEGVSGVAEGLEIPEINLGAVRQHQAKLSAEKEAKSQGKDRTATHSQASTSSRASNNASLRTTFSNSSEEGAKREDSIGPSESMKRGSRTGSLKSFISSNPETSFQATPRAETKPSSQAQTTGQTGKRLPGYQVRIPSGNIGYQMLKRAGWNEERGLGASEQGPLEPIKAHLKGDKRGIGAEKKVQGTDMVKKRKDSPNAGAADNQSKAQLTKAQIKRKREEERRKEEAIATYIYRAFAPDNV